MLTKIILCSQIRKEEKCIHVGDSRTTQVLGMEKFFLLNSHLTLFEMVHDFNICARLMLMDL